MSKQYLDESGVSHIISLLKALVNNAAGDYYLATTSIGDNGVSAIDIPFVCTSTDSLVVYQNGILLVQSIHYNATTTQITLIGYTANKGDLFTFVNKNLAAITLQANASNVSIVDNAGVLGGATTVEDALQYLGSKNDVPEGVMTTTSPQTMQAKFTAQNNTDYKTKQVRNIFLIPDGDSLPTGEAGDICLVYSIG